MKNMTIGNVNFGSDIIMIGRKKLVLIFMAAFVMLSQIGYWLPVSEEDAQMLFELYMSQLHDIDSIGIGIHNLTINTVMFVPGFGLIFGVFTAMQTGFAFAVANMVQDFPIEIPPALVLLVTPFGMMELIAYSIGMSRSYMLIRNVKKRKELKKMLKPTLKEYGIVVALLIVAGFIEYWMIQNSTDIVSMLGG